MDTRTKEAIRYLGYGKCAVDEKTLAMIQESFRELEEIARVKLVAAEDIDLNVFLLIIGDWHSVGEPIHEAPSKTLCIVIVILRSVNVVISYQTP